MGNGRKPYPQRRIWKSQSKALTKAMEMNAVEDVFKVTTESNVTVSFSWDFNMEKKKKPLCFPRYHIDKMMVEVCQDFFECEWSN